MIKHIFVLWIVTAIFSIGTIQAQETCQSNVDCGKDDYCAKINGDCDNKGICVPRSEGCPAVWIPVCGCDGQTYSNGCYAAMAGVNVDYSGECVPSCVSNGDCDGDEYCSKFAGDCDGEGNCEERPLGCPDVWDPVCGCDGQTYGNVCEAAAAGINVEYSGECLPPPPCLSNDDCDADDYCVKDESDCDSYGECTERPIACIKILDPVCGCDGQTYSNGCYAAMAGVNVDYSGECVPSCVSNGDCDGDDYCSKFAGDCDGEGNCEERPSVCPEIWDPVCGCDGLTYGNVCEAAAAGVNVNYTGECQPGPTVVMLEPKVVEDDVHTGTSGVNTLRILWSEAVIFDVNDISVVNEDASTVGVTASGNNTTIMAITFDPKLLHGIYTITISDTVVNAVGGYAIDGDNDGMMGGDAVIVSEHRRRSDFTNDNEVNFLDFAVFGNDWLKSF